MVSSILIKGVSVGEGVVGAGEWVGVSGVLDGRTMRVGSALAVDGASEEKGVGAVG